MKSKIIFKFVSDVRGENQFLLIVIEHFNESSWTV